jgi:hypothetical protein
MSAKPGDRLKAEVPTVSLTTTTNSWEPPSFTWIVSSFFVRMLSSTIGVAWFGMAAPVSFSRWFGAVRLPVFG